MNARWAVIAAAVGSIALSAQPALAAAPDPTVGQITAIAAGTQPNCSWTVTVSESGWTPSDPNQMGVQLIYWPGPIPGMGTPVLLITSNHLPTPLSQLSTPTLWSQTRSNQDPGSIRLILYEHWGVNWETMQTIDVNLGAPLGYANGYSGSCALDPPPPPAPTPAPTAASTPTPTPAPTAASTPTPTPTPAPTPTSTPSGAPPVSSSPPPGGSGSSPALIVSAPSRPTGATAASATPTPTPAAVATVAPALSAAVHHLDALRTWGGLVALLAVLVTLTATSAAGLWLRYRRS